MVDMIREFIEKFELPKIKKKIVSDATKRSRNLRKLEKKQQNQINREALKKGHIARIEKMKMKRFKDYNKNLMKVGGWND